MTKKEVNRISSQRLATTKASLKFIAQIIEINISTTSTVHILKGKKWSGLYREVFFLKATTRSQTEETRTNRAIRKCLNEVTSFVQRGGIICMKKRKMISPMDMAKFRFLVFVFIVLYYFCENKKKYPFAG